MSRQFWRSAARLDDDESGTALIEALIAAVVVISITTGVALLIVRSSRAVWMAGTQSAAAVAAQQKIEQLSALEWRFDASGVARSDSTTDLSIESSEASGSGLQPSPPDSLDRNTPGFVDFVAEDGRWRGRGAAPPSGAAFLRRWSITAYARDPAHTLVLTVVVLPIAEAGGRATHPAAVQLQSVRTRTAR
jgi:hypothetical protein